jgi:hypothetical protein
VTFNDHEGSTKSYTHTRKHQLPVVQADFVPFASEITVSYPEGTSQTVKLHDGSEVRFRKVAKDYDPTDRKAVLAYLEEQQISGEVPRACSSSTRSGGDARGSEDGGHAALGAAVRDALPGQRRAREADVRLPLSAPAAPLPPRECGYF